MYDDIWVVCWVFELFKLFNGVVCRYSCDIIYNVIIVKVFNFCWVKCIVYNIIKKKILKVLLLVIE